MEKLEFNGIEILCNKDVEFQVRTNDYRNRIFKQIVPAEGKASTEHGEVLRCANTICEEYHQNHNANAIKFSYPNCNDCGGSGYVKDNVTCQECAGTGFMVHVEMDSEFKYMISYLRKRLQKNVIDSIEYIMFNEYKRENHVDDIFVLYTMLDELAWRFVESKMDVA